MKRLENSGAQPEFLPGNFLRAAKNRTGRADQSDAFHLRLFRKNNRKIWNIHKRQSRDAGGVLRRLTAFEFRNAARAFCERGIRNSLVTCRKKSSKKKLDETDFLRLVLSEQKS